METYILGHEVQHNDQAWLVVRVVTSTSVFEIDESAVARVEEKYVQLRSATGEFDFVVLHENEQVDLKHSQIKALPPVPWRKNVKTNV